MDLTVEEMWYGREVYLIHADIQNIKKNGCLVSKFPTSELQFMHFIWMYKIMANVCKAGNTRGSPFTTGPKQRNCDRVVHHMQ